MVNKPLTIIQKIFISILLAIIFVFMSQLSDVKNLLSPLEDRVIDYQFLIRGQVSSDNDLIRIVLIDKDSAIDTYGYQSPTPRPLLTDLVNHLIAKEAAVIGIDVLLDQPSYWAGEDEGLAKALKDANGKVVLVTALGVDEKGQQESSYRIPLQPLPMFSQYSSLGYSQVLEGSGGIVRQLNLGATENPSFVAQMYAKYSGEELPFLRLNQQQILTESWIDINYLGPPSRLDTEGKTVFPVFTAEEIEFLPARLFKDKIVFIGSGIDELGDVFLSPFSTAASAYSPSHGVELHALVLNMLLKQNYLTSPSHLQLMAMLFALFFVLALIVMTVRIGLGGPIIIVLFIGWLFVVMWAFLHYQIKLPIITPLVGFIGVVGVCVLIINETQSRQARFLKNTFKRYIPAELVDQLIKNPDQVDLGGENKQLSIFFSDLENFTTISEQFTPHELVEFLNIYLGLMTDILFDEKGTLDKYEGDAIIAFFGAPVDVVEHADFACQAALRMQRALRKLNEEWKGENKPFLKVRIGINTGSVIVGNIGSDTRSDYTVIGDAVNLASRLEGVNKKFGTNIMISQQTLDATKKPYFKRELARLVVKGKTEAITVYQLIDCLPSEKEELQNLNEEYAVALQLFYNRDFQNSIKGFGNLAEEYGDQASEFMLSQAMYYLNNEPDENWNGAIVLTSK